MNNKQNKIDHSKILKTGSELEELSLKEMKQITGGHYCEEKSIGKKKILVCSKGSEGVTYQELAKPK